MDSARQLRGISCAERARRIGVDGKRLWCVLHGQREMRVDEFVKLCAFFNLSLVALGSDRALVRHHINCLSVGIPQQELSDESNLQALPEAA